MAHPPVLIPRCPAVAVGSWWMTANTRERGWPFPLQHRNGSKCKRAEWKRQWKRGEEGSPPLSGTEMEGASQLPTTSILLISILWLPEPFTRGFQHGACLTRACTTCHLECLIRGVELKGRREMREGERWRVWLKKPSCPVWAWSRDIEPIRSSSGMSVHTIQQFQTYILNTQCNIVGLKGNGASLLPEQDYVNKSQTVAMVSWIKFSSFWMCTQSWSQSRMEHLHSGFIPRWSVSSNTPGIEDRGRGVVGW